MADELQHRVSVRAAGVEIHNWNNYDVVCDMVNPADSFSLSLGPVDPFDIGAAARARALGVEDFGEAWHALRPDSLVEILIDDVIVMSGFVDERIGASSQADTLSINGRDKCGRLLDESMPLIKFNGLSLEALCLKICSPWLDKVAFSNTTNRSLVIGRGRGAKGGRVFKDPNAIPGIRHPRTYRKVEPGETRWNVLAYFMHENDLLAWGAADGRSLIVGEPNYDQEPTFRFFHPRAGSTREHLGNCTDFNVRDSVADRYSAIIAMGSNAGTARDYGESVVHRKGVARSGPRQYGEGADFQHRKVLLVPDDAIKNDKQAQTRAEREMAERDAGGHEITLTAYDHGQLFDSTARRASLFACDTIAHVESEVFGIKADYLITSVRFHGAREKRTTEIKLVPKGTLLRL
jgi:prophage tail gpP-like protein